MRAIVQDSYGTADVLRLCEVERPEPGDGEVLLRVAAAGVDPGVVHLMTGLPYPLRLAGYGLRRPRTRPGMDVAGRVEAVGAGVTRFRPGDEVFGIGKGTFAEYACAEQGKLAIRPPSLTPAQAAALAISGLTALQGVRDKGGACDGRRVLVVGAAGGVGSYAVQIAKALGAEVTGVCSTDATDLVASLGADHVVDRTREDFTASGRRHDTIVDTASALPLGRLRRVLTPRGTLVIVGAEGGGRWLGGLDRQLRALLLNPLVGQRLCPLVSSENSADLEALSALVEAGSLRPVIERTYALDDAADAVRQVARGRARGKVVLTV
ncbi:NAD(P)-dependent alcohol dehydrogenase [Streptomyces sp. 549]|uniref:NAD(P)-dependent alcohol dehydrogenase n=1 Tax=Streptomyces sp. 549 TaxID=3049076 RepID=UPI0024C3E6D0|nr:NAD(P)-dependent alcohol dehydrogenase [Streptomyces sp. 549]MDK1472060.1 NAD(P)-dependent alcohol dehydrogenase [Streptomyces sp. 549]